MIGLQQERGSGSLQSDGFGRGFTGLSGMVQTALKENPFQVMCCISWGAEEILIKMLWWDGDGLCSSRKDWSEEDSSGAS